MTDVSNQRRMAAAILKCGQNRVWLPPDAEKLQEISEATTRAAVRSLIVRRYIRKLPIKGVSRGRARVFQDQRHKGRRRGAGSRKGKFGARTPSKRSWITRIRTIRRTLKRLRDRKTIPAQVYRHYYRMAKGGQFHSNAHLLAQMETRGDLQPLPGRPARILKEEPKKAAPKKVDKVKAPKPAEPKRKGLLGRRKADKEE
jgi:large subunit ribosomal protein L19e